MIWSQLLTTKKQVSRVNEPRKWSEYPINDFEKDYQSIISSAAFRRLQDKTQVFPLDKSDFVRTRLTHSIEVSTIAKQLGVMVTNNNTGYLQEDFENESLKQYIPSILSCAGLLHDLGNPPFGHFGEVVIGDWFKKELVNPNFKYKDKPINELLNEQMKSDLCNFEGNAQALRILSKVEQNSEGYDLNLTYATIATLIKYPSDSLKMDPDSADIRIHKTGYFLSERDLFDKVSSETGINIENCCVRHPLTFLMEAADDIAYSTSDLEDALKKRMFSMDEFLEYFEKRINDLPDGNPRNKTNDLFLELKNKLGKQIRNTENDLVAFQNWAVYVKGWLMYAVAYSFSKEYDSIMSGEYNQDLFENTFHKYTVQILKDAMKKFVFNSSSILKLELSANKIISSLLNDFVYAIINMDEDGKDKLTKKDKKLINIISENYKFDYESSKGEDEIYNLYLRFLMVTDYISGMTDSFAKNLYQELNGID